MEPLFHCLSIPAAENPAIRPIKTRHALHAVEKRLGGATGE
jgi:hypothetical protein